MLGIHFIDSQGFLRIIDRPCGCQKVGHGA